MSIESKFFIELMFWSIELKFCSFLHLFPQVVLNAIANHPLIKIIFDYVVFICKWTGRSLSLPLMFFWLNGWKPSFSLLRINPNGEEAEIVKLYWCAQHQIAELLRVAIG